MKTTLTLAAAAFAFLFFTGTQVSAKDDGVNWDHYSKIGDKESWKTWRTNYPDKKPDLRNGDFSTEKGFRDLTDMDLSNCDLRKANLKGAKLSGTDLTGAKLEGADLRGAYYSGATKFPEGFDPRAAGMFLG
jgi:uncharacterized protein YjbI with pentapeptide repeats